jgi:hypothetical protein
MKNACFECEYTGFLHMTEGSEFGDRVIQRCDLCRVFPDDNAAREMHDLVEPRCRFLAGGDVLAWDRKR